MARLYTDASYCDGMGGMAVVAPAWSAGCWGWWRSRWDVRAVHVPDRGAVVFCAACRCADPNDAEKRAMGMAFLLALDMMTAAPGLRVEIASDSLVVIDGIVSGSAWPDPIIEGLARLRVEGGIVLSKVKGHNGNWGNELADQWSKRARRKLRDRYQNTYRR